MLLVKALKTWNWTSKHLWVVCAVTNIAPDTQAGEAWNRQGILEWDKLNQTNQKKTTTCAMLCLGGWQIPSQKPAHLDVDK